LADRPVVAGSVILVGIDGGAKGGLSKEADQSPKLRVMEPNWSIFGWP